MSDAIGRALGRWWVAIGAAAIAAVMFAWAVPRGVEHVTNGRTLWPKILDEYYPTWTEADARNLYAALGPAGRLAYRAFYLQLDFWIPMLSLSICYAALLSLAFPAGSRWRALNLLAVVMYFSDVAENLNHFTMAGSYPDLPTVQLTLGPWFTLIKYALITLLPVAMIIGFVARRRVSTR